MTTLVLVTEAPGVGIVYARYVDGKRGDAFASGYALHPLDVETLRTDPVWFAEVQDVEVHQ